MTREEIAELCEAADQAAQGSDEILERASRFAEAQRSKDVVYKTHYEPPPAPSSEAIEEVWREMGELADEAGAATGKLEKQINELRERIIKLEATNDVLRSFIGAKVATASLTSIHGGKASDAA